MKNFFLHLISDSTGETVQSLSRACLALFPPFLAIERLHPLIHNESRMKKIFPLLEAEPGIVIFSLASQTLSERLQEFCNNKSFPYFSILKGPLDALTNYFGCEPVEQSGAQHAMGDSYFRRIEAIHFTLAHDDGNGMDTLGEADIILFGVSRTSKTPTCFQLANRGFRAANVPFIPNIPIPQELTGILKNRKTPAMFGLTCDCEHLLALRRNRLHSIGQEASYDYADPDSVREEIAAARKFFQKLGVIRLIDVTNRSIEETASAIVRDMEKEGQVPSLDPIN